MHTRTEGAPARAVTRWTSVVAFGVVLMLSPNLAEALNFRSTSLSEVRPNVAALREEGRISEAQEALYSTVQSGTPQEIIAACDVLLADEDLDEALRDYLEPKRLLRLRTETGTLYSGDRGRYFIEALEWIDERPGHPLNLSVRYDLLMRLWNQNCADCWSERSRENPDRVPFPLRCEERLNAMVDVFATAFLHHPFYDEDMVELAHEYVRNLGRMSDQIRQGIRNRIDAEYADDRETRRANSWRATQAKVEVQKLQKQEADNIIHQLNLYLDDPALQGEYGDRLRPAVAERMLDRFAALHRSAANDIERDMQTLDFQKAEARGKISVRDPSEMDTVTEDIVMPDGTVYQRIWFISPDD